MSMIPEDFIDDPRILAQVRTHNVERIIQNRRDSFMGYQGALMNPGGKGARDEKVVDI